MCTEEGANKLDLAGRQTSDLPNAEEDIDLGPKQPKGGILPVLRQKYRRILQAGPSTSTKGKAQEGETSREVRFGGGRPCVEPSAQASPEEDSPAKPTEQPGGSKGRSILWRNTAPCDQTEAAEIQQQAGEEPQAVVKPEPARPQGSEAQSQ